MDDDDRRELDALRRRAYGPGGGLTDAAAVARLEELESASRGAASVVEDDPSTSSGTATSAGTETSAEAATSSGTATSTGTETSAEAATSPATEPSSATGGIRRRLLTGAAVIVAAVVLTAIVVPRLADAESSSAESEPTPTAYPTESTAALAPSPAVRRFLEDPAAETIMTIELGGYFSQPDPSPVPVLPVYGAQRWIDTVGVYYGQRIWVAGTDVGDLCLVLEATDTTRTSCLGHADFESEALAITVAFDDIPEDERPPEMEAQEALGFWWRSDDRIDIILSPSPPSADGD